MIRISVAARNAGVDAIAALLLPVSLPMSAE